MQTQGDSVISLLQLNLHTSPRCNMEVNHWLANHDDRIALCQEPGQKKGKILNIDSNIKCFTGVPTGSNVRPRACILASPNLTILKISQFCSQDQVVISIDDEDSGKKLIFASIYMPGDSIEPPPSQLTQDLVTFCEHKDWPIIIGTDCNSHNTVWGSTNDNQRGHNLLEYLVTTNLFICNIGNSPTFVNAIRSEVLDITLASLNITDRIFHWTVSNKDMLSDHRPIEFTVQKYNTQAIHYYRNIKKTRWEQYNRQLKQYLTELDDTASLEDMATNISTAISRAYGKSCTPNKGGRKKRHSWWTEELTNLKKDYKHKRSKYFRDRTDENRTDRNRADAKYKLAIKRAKNDSWRNFCEQLEDLSATARMHRIMKNGKANKLAL